jgi:hypothetical protein
MGKVWLVGEDNPYGSDPKYALYPYPERASGHRLMEILGLSLREYLGPNIQRRNLCRRKWNAKEAAKAAETLLEEAEGQPMVLLGRKVAGAFLVANQPPFTTTTSADLSRLMGRARGPLFAHVCRSVLLLLPHPSGRCRDWNVAGSRDRARIAVHRLRFPESS